MLYQAVHLGGGKSTATFTTFAEAMAYQESFVPGTVGIRKAVNQDLVDQATLSSTKARSGKYWVWKEEPNGLLTRCTGYAGTFEEAVRTRNQMAALYTDFRYIIREE